MAIKRLHSFSINVSREVEEVSTSIQDGKEITVKSKVTKEVPITFIIKEPNRRERQDLSLFYGVAYNEALEKKLMPKVLLVQKVLRNGDSDSPLSLDEDKNLAKMYDQINEYRNDFIRLNSITDSEEQQKKKEEVLTNYLTVQKKIIDVESSYRSLFAHTAETYAQNKAITWLVLNLSYKVNEKGEEVPYFEGKTFEDKENNLFDLEEKSDEVYFKVVDKLSTYCSLYFLGQATKPEDFQKIEEQIKKEQELAEAAKKEESKEIKPVEEPQNVV
jgi:hypothetical protein